MTYFILQNHRDEPIGGRFYLDLNAARAVAKRTAGKWRKNPALRGGGIKIVMDNGSLYRETIEWVLAD